MNMKDNQKTIRFLHKEKCDNKNLYAIINIKAMELSTEIVYNISASGAVRGNGAHRGF